ncbi:MAG: DUF4476 domain-containing protein [Alphaproteobacteria bacterium]|nr:DUF4476 domain-containing protein [Alphaproteobacteria bacterium]MCB9794331.1 DUF4476 domain-containing protein [Alphaproteobacteria bacterium]
MLALLATFALAPSAIAGDIVIDAPPMASVYIDGQLARVEADGRTRVSPWLAGGAHLVEVHGRHGELRHRDWVDVPATARLSLQADRYGLYQLDLAHLYAPERGRGHGHHGEAYQVDYSAQYGWDSQRGDYRYTPQPEVQVVVVEHQPQRPPRGPQAMPADRFNHLILAMEAEPFGDDKMALLMAASGDWVFTIDQVGRAMDAMTFSSEKVEVARLLRPRVIDPENAWSLNAHLTFSSDKREVQAMYV